MKYKLELRANLLPSNSHLYPHQDKSLKWPEFDSLNREMIDDYFFNLVNNIQVDDALSDWTLTVQVFIGTYLGDNHLVIGKRGITYTATKEKYISIRIPLPYYKVARWGIEKKFRFCSYPVSEEKNQFIPVDFTQYNDIGIYLEDMIKSGLLNLFEIGFTLKGYKIKK